MRRKTPQEKKALSYAKDRRNSYGQNDKASRRLVPVRKAKVNRGYRRKINEILSEAKSFDPAETDSLDSSAKNVRRIYWKKCADEPLGKFLRRKLERRESHTGHGKTARKRATDFLKILKIEIGQEDDGRWIAEAVEMHGVVRYGATREDAIARCKDLARVIFLEQLGAVDQVRVSVDVTSYRSK